MNKKQLKEAIEGHVVRADDCMMNQNVIPLKVIKVLIDQLDESDITEKQAMDKLAESLPLSVTQISHHLAHLMIYRGKVTYGELDEPEKISNFDIEKLKDWVKKHQDPEYPNNPRMTLINAQATLDKIEKCIVIPVIPDFVAEWIETHKTSHSLYEVLWQAWNEDLDDHRLQKWIDNNSGKHDEVFACAWLAYPNIEVEKEKTYYVLDKEGHVMLRRYDVGVSSMKISSTLTPEEFRKHEKDSIQLTEQEIKDYDPRYMAFAEEVG